MLPHHIIGNMLNMVIGATLGIAFLHALDNQVLYCGIKASNIFVEAVRFVLFNKTEVRLELRPASSAAH
jgi:hypothetical protein